MKLRKYLKGTLCGIVSGLAGCMPRYVEPNIKQPVPIEQELEKPAESVPAESRRLKTWQIPVNVLGGFFTHIFAHEGGHALTCLAQGGKIEEFHPYPGFINGRFREGWVRYEPGSLEHLSQPEHAFRNIAGPAADILLAEIINYNLRNGNISLSNQPFWATTSLISRIAPLSYVTITVIRNPKDPINDFLSFERNSGVSKETMLGLISAYTLLNAKRIVKEFKVALGRDSYDYNPKKGELNLVPYKDGLMVSYSLNF